MNDLNFYYWSNGIISLGAAVYSMYWIARTNIYSSSPFHISELNLPSLLLFYSLCCTIRLLISSGSEKQ